MRGLRATCAIAAVMALGSAAPASAQDILNDFRRSGTINPCQYSDGQLRRGLKGLPPDIQQYAPGLADQLAAGREGCGGGGGGGGGGTPATAAAPAPRGGGGGGPVPPSAAPQISIPAPPAPSARAARPFANIETPTVATATGSDAPGWLVPLLAALALVAALLAFARLRGLSAERFTRPLRASLAEAGGRTADALTQLRESVRLGR